MLAALGLDIPVSLANDANLGALAEHRRGVGVGVDDLVYISGNVGVGAGIITGGVQLEGAGGYAGEVGHLRFNPMGLPCHCGNVGCWETEVGAHAIAKAISCPESEVVQLGEVLATYAEADARAAPHRRGPGAGAGHHRQRVQPEAGRAGGLPRPALRAGAAAGPGRARRACAARPRLESVTLSLPGLGGDSVLLGAAEIAFEPLFVDPVAALGAALVDVRSRLAG